MEIVKSVLVMGRAWLDVQAGTFRRTVDFPPLFDGSENVWTWLNGGARFYARAESILCVEVEATVESSQDETH
jgi:hypothetical protein